ncbi:MAG: phosphatidate cytidylyltransferase [Candidatus Krumholzibacteriia bacterium]
MAVRPEVTTPSRSRDRLSGLGTRVLSAAVFGPCLVIIAWRGEHYFVLLVNLLLVTAVWEFQRMVAAKGLEPDAFVGFTSAVVFPWAVYLGGGVWADVALAGLLVAMLIRATLRAEARDAILRAGVTSFGFLWLVWLGSHLVSLRELPRTVVRPDASGFAFVLLAFVFVWVSDTGGYLVGSLLGRHKLAPGISPGKTVEGSVGAIVLTLAAGVAASWTFLASVLTPFSGALLGLLASVVGQIGDLLESLLKRDANVKDASHVIPGHGGVLDRFDSVLFVGPLLYYALRFIVL